MAAVNGNSFPFKILPSRYHYTNQSPRLRSPLNHIPPNLYFTRKVKSHIMESPTQHTTRPIMFCLANFRVGRTKWGVCFYMLNFGISWRCHVSISFSFQASFYLRIGVERDYSDAFMFTSFAPLFFFSLVV